MHQREASFSAFVESAGGIDTVAHSTVRLYTPLEFLVRVEVEAGNRQGLFARRRGLELSGRVHLPEIRAEFIFRRHDRAADDGSDQQAMAIVVPRGSSLPIATQPIQATLPERVDLWVLESEPHRQQPWGEHYAGRCGQRGVVFERHVPVSASLDMCFRADERQKGRGTKVEMWGEICFEQGMSMRFVLREPDRPVAPPSEGDSTEVMVIATGTRMTILRQSVSAVVGARPQISVRVTEPGGRVLCAEHALGYSKRFW